MSRPARYQVPAATHRIETTIDRSRFVATVGRASSVEEARAFIASVSHEFADASHNCWAYVAGPPGDTGKVGMGDAGEPHGTAGRPMLAVLLGSGVGDVVAVVTRYFGGVKLGRGGLVRAYAGSVKRALEGLPLEELVQRRRLRVTVEYAHADPIKRALGGFEAEVEQEDYGAKVVLELSLPVEHVERFTEVLAGMTNGTARIESQ